MDHDFFVIAEPPQSEGDSTEAVPAVPSAFPGLLCETAGQADKSSSYTNSLLSQFSFKSSSAGSSFTFSPALVDKVFIEEHGREEGYLINTAPQPPYEPPSLDAVIADWSHSLPGLRVESAIQETSVCADPLLISADDPSMAPRGIKTGRPSSSSVGSLPVLVPCKKPLSRGRIVAYGSGHMLNDIAAACWFTYLLIYCTDVGLSPQ